MLVRSSCIWSALPLLLDDVLFSISCFSVVAVVQFWVEDKKKIQFQAKPYSNDSRKTCVRHCVRWPSAHWHTHTHTRIIIWLHDRRIVLIFYLMGVRAMCGWSRKFHFVNECQIALGTGKCAHLRFWLNMYNVRMLSLVYPFEIRYGECVIVSRTYNIRIHMYLYVHLSESELPYLAWVQPHTSRLHRVHNNNNQIQSLCSSLLAIFCVCCAVLEFLL